MFRERKTYRRHMIASLQHCNTCLGLPQVLDLQEVLGNFLTQVRHDHLSWSRQQLSLNLVLKRKAVYQAVW